MASFDSTLHGAALRTRSAKRSVQVVLLAMLLGACSGGERDSVASGETDSAAQVMSAESLRNTYWQVVRINGSALLDGSVATVILNDEGELAGDTSCNRYFGRWSVSGTSASFEPAGVTRRACERAVMEQERAVLDALVAADRVEQGEDGELSLLDSEGAVRVDLVAAVGPDSEAPAEAPEDLPGSTEHRFLCSDLGTVAFRFVGPDTIELRAGEARFVLPRQRTASGARYASEDAEFWNKGDEAMLTIGDSRYTCERSSDG
jgi:heat shock protein HslJ